MYQITLQYYSIESHQTSAFNFKPRVIIIEIFSLLLCGQPHSIKIIAIIIIIKFDVYCSLNYVVEVKRCHFSVIE